MKKFISGFLIGAMLFLFAPVSAAIEEYLCYKADYKVTINGEEYISDLPILNYKGNTYAPFRSILEKAGLDVNWNAELGQVEVSSPTSTQINNVEETKMSIEYDAVTGLPFGAEYVENEKEGKNYKTILYNGETYISTSDLKRLYDITSSFVDVNNKTCTFVKEGESVTVNVNSALYVKAFVYYDQSLFHSMM
jgi:hypothetical protein